LTSINLSFTVNERLYAHLNNVYRHVKNNRQKCDNLYFSTNAIAFWPNWLLKYQVRIFEILGNQFLEFLTLTFLTHNSLTLMFNANVNANVFEFLTLTFVNTKFRGTLYYSILFNFLPLIFWKI